MELEVKELMASLGAEIKDSIFPNILDYSMCTGLGLCSVQIRLSECVMLVNFFERPFVVQSVFGSNRVDMVGTKQHFVEEIKEHFQFIFDKIEKESVSLHLN